MEKPTEEIKMPDTWTDEMRFKWMAQLEDMKTEKERLFLQYQAEHQGNLEMFKSVITAGQGTLKSAILINGGGAIALLAFIGSLWASTNSEVAINGKTGESLLFAMAFYAGGTLISAIAAAETYLAQYAYSRKHNKTGNFLQGVICLSVMLGGYGGFAWASWLAFSAIRIHFTGCY